MPLLRPLAAGLAGALTLNALNEVAHRLAPPDAAHRAPRLDRLGTAVLARTLGLDVQPDRQADAAGPVYAAALALDVAANALAYALVGSGTGRPILRGLGIGALNGVAAVAGARLVGRGEDVDRAPTTPALTVLWYVAGGLAAGATARALARR